MDADLSRFKTIVLKRPGQLWAGSSGVRWKDFFLYVWFSWAADWRSHFVVQGTDSNFNKITWINFHPNPSSCPLNVLGYVQPPLHCMRWRRKLGPIGCLNDESSDDNAEHADDEGGVGECPERTCALLERALQDATEASQPEKVSKSCALKPKSKRRKWRPRPGRCVGQSRLSRQRRTKASTQQRDRRGLRGTCAEGSFQPIRHLRAALLECPGR